MLKESDRIVQTLKERGLRVTPQRFAVYANLLNRDDHPTAEQLLQDLNQDVPTSSQSTVYSSLEALCKAGLIREVLLEEGVCRYDANIAQHHHFRCQGCNRIEDIAWDHLPGIDLSALRSGLKVEGYEVTLSGHCENCQAD
jgi:Fur family transcriptional regulator, peroxide stress response regulator